MLTTLAGYYLGAGQADTIRLFHTIVGTALVAGGASAFNQVFERVSDGLMRRTRTRPLAGRAPAPRASRLVRCRALCAGTLGAGVGRQSRGCLGRSRDARPSYVAVYTPLKRITPLATLVGGVPGALPAMIGWGAARGTLSAEAWILFGIVFLWQMPHFLAIAWMYREDYARAGLPMLPVVAPDGRSTAAQAVLYASVLVPVSLAAAAVGLAGSIYLAGALVMGLGYLALGIRFALSRTNLTARRLFFGSIVYLPAILALLVADRR